MLSTPFLFLARAGATNMHRALLRPACSWGSIHVKTKVKNRLLSGWSMSATRWVRTGLIAVQTGVLVSSKRCAIGGQVA